MGVNTYMGVGTKMNVGTHSSRNEQSVRVFFVASVLGNYRGLPS